MPESREPYESGPESGPVSESQRVEIRIPSFDEITPGYELLVSEVQRTLSVTGTILDELAQPKYQALGAEALDDLRATLIGKSLEVLSFEHGGVKHVWQCYAEKPSFSFRRLGGTQPDKNQEFSLRVGKQDESYWFDPNDPKVSSQGRQPLSNAEFADCTNLAREFSQQFFDSTSTLQHVELRDRETGQSIIINFTRRKDTLVPESMFSGDGTGFYFTSDGQLTYESSSEEPVVVIARITEAAAPVPAPAHAPEPAPAEAGEGSEHRADEASLRELYLQRFGYQDVRGLLWSLEDLGHSLQRTFDEQSERVKREGLTERQLEYVKLYAALVDEFGESRVESRVGEIQADYRDLVQKLGIDDSIYGKSSTWARWDFVKQAWYARYPKKADSFYYHPVDILREPDQDKIDRMKREIADRHLGWEIYNIVSNPDQAQQAAIPEWLRTDDSYSSIQVLLDPESDGHVPSFRLSAVGKIVRECIAKHERMNSLASPDTTEMGTTQPRLLAEIEVIAKSVEGGVPPPPSWPKNFPKLIAMRINPFTLRQFAVMLHAQGLRIDAPELDWEGDSTGTYNKLINLNQLITQYGSVEAARATAVARFKHLEQADPANAAEYQRLLAELEDTWPDREDA